MKNLKNSFNIHPNEKTSDKEFDQLLCVLEERYELACEAIHICFGRGEGAYGRCG